MAVPAITDQVPAVQGPVTDHPAEIILKNLNAAVPITVPVAVPEPHQVVQIEPLAVMAVVAEVWTPPVAGPDFAQIVLLPQEAPEAMPRTITLTVVVAAEEVHVRMAAKGVMV